MKLKRTWALAAAIVLSMSLALGTTLAYLTDTDSQVNVMTLGNVDIEQHEFERKVDKDGNYVTDTIDGVTSYVLQPFTQMKPLMPFVGSVTGGYDSIPVRLSQLGHNSRGGMDVLPANNVQDKFIVVENTGRSDAYVRTIVGFEAGSVAEEDWYKLISYSAHFTWKETQDWFVTEVDGNNYYFVEFVYNGYQDIQHPNGVLTPGDYTYNSLAQVYMFDTATNEDVVALDGNKNGTFDILTLSQAVQTAGFADAETALKAGFGEFNEENVQKWFGGMTPVITVSTADEAVAAIKSGNANVYYTGNAPVVIDKVLKVQGEVEIDLGGAELKFEGSSGFEIGDGAEGVLTVTNAKIEGQNNLLGSFVVGEGGELVLGEGVEIANCGSNLIRVHSDGSAPAKLVLDGAQITGNNVADNLIIVAADSELVIKEGTVIANNTITGNNNYLMKVDGKVTMNGGEIKGNSVAGRGLVNLSTAGEFIMNGGEISNNVGAKYVFNVMGSTPSVKLNGGLIDIAGDGLIDVYFANTTVNGTTIVK